MQLDELTKYTIVKQGRSTSALGSAWQGNKFYNFFIPDIKDQLYTNTLPAKAYVSLERHVGGDTPPKALSSHDCTPRKELDALINKKKMFFFKMDMEGKFLTIGSVPRLRQFVCFFDGYRLLVPGFGCISSRDFLDWIWVQETEYYSVNPNVEYVGTEKQGNSVKRFRLD